MPLFLRKPAYQLVQPATAPLPAYPLARAGLYHVPEGTNLLGLLYLLHQIMDLPAAPGLSINGAQLSIARLPRLGMDMLQRANDFHGPVMLISAACAYRLQIAHELTAFLADAIDLPPALQWRLETVLHEGISNAIHHGSLELPPISSDALTNERVNDPAYGGRMIALGWQMGDDGIDCFIMDQGPGFDAPTFIGKEAPSYKGLSLLRSLCRRTTYSYDGRCLDFTLPLTI